jgi:hypothetical protein
VDLRWSGGGCGKETVGSIVEEALGGGRLSEAAYLMALHHLAQQAASHWRVGASLFPPALNRSVAGR